MEQDDFESLSWDHLEQWAGPTILARGKKYLHRVSDLAVTKEKHLVANVKGSDLYLTHVWVSRGEPDYECSCPYWAPCKHAVAVILAYLEYIKSNTSVPKIRPTEFDARISVYSLAERQDDKPDFDLEGAHLALQALSKTKIIEWALDLFADDPALFDTLPSTKSPSRTRPDKALARVRELIRKLGDERGWRDHWNNRGYVPDYSPVRTQLKKLFSGGHFEDILELGEELLRLGITQVEESDDEGETALELNSCLEVVFDAMRLSQNPAADRMIWFWDKLLNDDYGILEGLTPPVDNPEMNQSDWRQVAEEFNTRLANFPKPNKDSSWFSGSYNRQRLLSYTTEALCQAGEDERAVELMISELPYCNNYVELVDELLEGEAYDQAEHWAYQGFENTVGSMRGVANQLLSRLIDISRQRKSWPMVAALRIDDFLHETGIDNYRSAKEASQKAGCWKQIQSELSHFLETGKSPLSNANWPLPPSGLIFPKPKYAQRFPACDELIEIALYEQRAEDALHWFQKAPNKDRHAEAIAQIVKKTHPDVSLDIWQHKVERLIGLVKPAAYRDAMPYLHKMKKLMQSNGQGDDYRQYVLTLRVQHKAKRRLMEELDSLDSRRKKRRILDS